jgi:uncharacterized protein (TIGR03435 family)
MKRAPISAILSVSMVFGAAAAMAQSHPARRATRIEQGIAANLVHITATTMKAGSTSIEVGADRWNARGFDLKTLISQIYNVDMRRIDFPDNGLAAARYDMTLALPEDVDVDTMELILQGALEKKFGLAIAEQTRTMDVYVLTAPNGPGTALHPHVSAARRGAKPLLVSAGSAHDGDQSADVDLEQITYLGRDCSGVSSGGILASAGTIGEFRRTLEPDLDRLLVDETGLKGSYDFAIGSYRNQDELFKQMHEQLGLAVTPAQRKVTVLTVRPADEMHAAL